LSDEAVRRELEFQLTDIKKSLGGSAAPVKPIEIPKPATWSSKEPSSDWCPAELKPHLSYAASTKRSISMMILSKGA